MDQMFQQTGALLSLDEETLVVGSGKCRRNSKPDINAANFYFPDFFLKDQFPWYVFEKVQVIKKSTLATQTPSISHHFSPFGTDGFLKAKESLSTFDLEKIVPYLLYQSPKKVTIQHLVSQICRTKGRFLYGYWKDGKGMIGATPESLFLKQGDQIKTMACAGTGKTGDIINDPKINREHQLVIDGIECSLSPFGSIEKSATQCVTFGLLSHLVTPINCKLKTPFDFQGIVNALHPTPALGAFPKERGWDFLNAFDRLIPRGNYGAPVGFLSKDHAFAYVAIRGVQFDENTLSVPVGCGVIKDSVMEDELEETHLKLASVKEAFGL